MEAAGMHRLRHFACDFLVGTEPSCRCPHLSCHEDMPPSPWSCVPHEQSPFSCNTEALPGGVLISPFTWSLTPIPQVAADTSVRRVEGQSVAPISQSLSCVPSATPLPPSQPSGMMLGAYSAGLSVLPGLVSNTALRGQVEFGPIRSVAPSFALAYLVSLVMTLMMNTSLLLDLSPSVVTDCGVSM